MIRFLLYLLLAALIGCGKGGGSQGASTDTGTGIAGGQGSDTVSPGADSASATRGSETETADSASEPTADSATATRSDTATGTGGDTGRDSATGESDP